MALTIRNQAAGTVINRDIRVIWYAVTLIPVELCARVVVGILGAIIAVVIAEVVDTTAIPVAVRYGARRAVFRGIEEGTAVKAGAGVGQRVIADMLFVHFVVAVIVQRIANLASVGSDEVRCVITITTDIDVVRRRRVARRDDAIIITVAILIEVWIKGRLASDAIVVVITIKQAASPSSSSSAQLTTPSQL